MPGQERVVSQPTQADTLGQDVAGFHSRPSRLDAEFVDPLQPCATPAMRLAIQADIETVGTATSNQRHVGEVRPRKVLGQTSFDHCCIEQLMHMPLFRFQRDYSVAGQGFRPIGPRRMSRDKGLHFAEVKSREAGDVKCEQDCIACVRWFIHDKQRTLPVGVPSQLLAFPSSRTSFRLDGQRGHRVIPFGFEEGAQQRGKIGACGTQPQHEYRLRTIWRTSHEAVPESQDIDVRQIKPTECGWDVEAHGLQAGWQGRL